MEQYILDEALIEDLKKLIDIADSQDSKISITTVQNFWSSLARKYRTDDTYIVIQNYLNEQGIEIVYEDVDIEAASSQIRPFDPSKIDITMKTITMDSLLKRISNDELNLQTGFQRKSGLWKKKQKSQLIESLLLKIPLPAFYFDASDDENWLIIDGLQRITVFKEFFIDKTLKLSQLEFFDDLNDKGYDDLPRVMIRRIEETNIIVYTVNPSTPKEVKYNIFKRINTGGLELENQEIRHALNQGTASDLVKNMALKKSFIEATGGSIKTDRMGDREFALRFVAVCYFGIDQYQDSAAVFLDETMEFISKTFSDSQCEEVTDRFNTIMNVAHEIFEKHTFRTMAEDSLTTEGRRRPINRAVFESWCYTLHFMSSKEHEKIIINREIVINKFIDLCASDEFAVNIKATDKNNFLNRFALIKQLIMEVL